MVTLNEGAKPSTIANERAAMVSPIERRTGSPEQERKTNDEARPSITDPERKADQEEEDQAPAKSEDSKPAEVPDSEVTNPDTNDNIAVETVIGPNPNGEAEHEEEEGDHVVDGDEDNIVY